ncbi:MAG: ExbD/TolR family protein [Verrucomicrobiales bacterium]
MKKRNRLAGRPQPEDASIDMSPMIDMVFQIIIFFMVTFQLVTIKKDPRVVVAIAPKGQVSKNTTGRVLINVLSDAKMKAEGLSTPYVDVDGKPLEFDQITELVIKEKAENDKTNTATSLMLRGDKESLVRRTKMALAAAGAAGVNDVVFSALQKEPPPKMTR